MHIVFVQMCWFLLALDIIDILWFIQISAWQKIYLKSVNVNLVTSNIFSAEIWNVYFSLNMKFE